MPKILISTLFIIALLLNCTQQNTNTASERINGNKLELLVKDAIQGNAISNFKLSGFLISYTPPGENYNKLIIDSTVTSSGIKLYSVLLEFPNPVFNILAVYDENLSLYLQDNSLNGNIAVAWENISEKQYLVSSENFLSKDRIELSRLSLYSFADSKLSLVFRSFTRIKEAGKIHEQNIIFLDEEKITTRITSNNKNLNNKTVTYNYSTRDQKYVNTGNIFYNFILAEIKNASWKIEKPELTMETVEKIRADSKRTKQNKNENPINGDQGFLRSSDTDWSHTFNTCVTKHL